MKRDEFRFTDHLGHSVQVYRWLPDNTPIALVQIAHGMAEHAGRYDRFARALTREGFGVFANDHISHGKTATSLEQIGLPSKENTFFHTMRNMAKLTDIMRDDYPSAPVFLFGHSMGSFLTQAYMARYGKGLKGVILSATMGDNFPATQAGIVLSSINSFVFGRNNRSKLLNYLAFGAFNNDFIPARTAFDWLSSDPAEVDKYIHDPFCGGVISVGFFHDLFIGIEWMHRRAVQNNIPRDLPIYLISGDKDPVGMRTKSVKKLAVSYRKLKIQDVAVRFYPEGRHESLNEINREEVTQDIINWLKDKLNQQTI